MPCLQGSRQNEGWSGSVDLRGEEQFDRPKLRLHSKTMGRIARNAHPEILPFDAALNELEQSAHLTPARVVELLQMLPPSRVAHGSADIIRELRGPLPDDHQ